MEPYYASWPKISFLLAAGGSTSTRVTKRTRTLRTTVGLNPAVEGSLTREDSDDPAELQNPAIALGQLDVAIRELQPRLVDPTDPTLAYGDWFEIVAPADFGILHRDSYLDGQEVATWFLGIPSQKLGVAVWIVLTGTPCHLRERWTGENTRNRSGSGTNSAFDLLTAIAEGRPIADKSPSARVFGAVASMRGMITGSAHQIRTIAEVKHVIRYDNTGYSISNESGSEFPVVMLVLASPLFVERNRGPISDPNYSSSSPVTGKRKSPFRRWNQK